MPAGVDVATNLSTPAEVGCQGARRRLVDTRSSAILHQLRDSDLPAAGKVALVGLDAIVERLGPRWSSRRELVYEHAAKVLRDGLGPLALVQRINETNYIVAQPSASPVAAQLSCIQALRAILKHFLGSAADSDIAVHRVTLITNDAVIGARIDPNHIETTMEHERPGASIPAGSSYLPATAPPCVAKPGGRPFIVTPVETSFTVDPVTHLPTGRQIGFRIGCRARGGPGFDRMLSRRELEDRLSGPDLADLDAALLAQGLASLGSPNAKGAPLSLMLPFSYESLRGRTGRGRIEALLRQAHTLVRGHLICEVTGIENAPPAVMRDAINNLRPFCRYVVGWLTDLDALDLGRLSAMKLNGLSAEVGTLGGGEDITTPLRKIIRVTSGVSKTFFLHGLVGQRAANVASRLGVTHISSHSGPASSKSDPAADGVLNHSIGGQPQARRTCAGGHLLMR